MSEVRSQKWKMSWAFPFHSAVSSPHPCCTALCLFFVLCGWNFTQSSFYVYRKNLFCPRQVPCTVVDDACWRWALMNTCIAGEHFRNTDCHSLFGHKPCSSPVSEESNLARKLGVIQEIQCLVQQAKSTFCLSLNVVSLVLLSMHWTSLLRFFRYCTL